MPAAVIVFDWAEYLIFGIMLSLSAFIGVYFGFIKGGQDTVDGYLLGGKQMGVFPISMSLVSSFISGITILGIPTEIYTYGSQYITATICYFLVGLGCAFIFLPVFYKLQVISVYEYMELRFNSHVRKLVSFLYTLSLFFYIPVVIYGPAMALNQVSGLDVFQMCLIVCIICTFYTTFGGLKAVVWSDTIQGGVMVLASLAVAVIGTVKVGGISAIIQAAAERDRLEFFDMDPDPRKRLTFWTILFGLTIFWTGASTVSPSAVQRFVSLNTFKKALWTVLYFKLGCLLLFALSAYMGLVIFARYKDCDPLASGMIQRADQILPYFILDVTGHVRGLPGLFLAGVVCAALSTMSTGLNTVAGTIYEDFIEPMMGKTTDARASMIMKILVVIFGTICLFLVMVIEKLGSLIELGAAFGGLTCGSILGMFILGMFFPTTNSMGAFVGGVVSLVAMTWVMICNRSAVSRGEIVYPFKPISIEGCTNNITSISSNLNRSPRVGEVFPLYEVSIFYYTLMGSVMTVILGIFTSYATGPNKTEKVDRSLLSPLIHGLLPKYTAVPVNDAQLKCIRATSKQ